MDSVETRVAEQIDKATEHTPGWTMSQVREARNSHGKLSIWATMFDQLVAAERRQGWIPISQKPERAGWYNVLRDSDGHRSVRCWDDSIEAWMYVGDGPGHSHFVPNNAFTHWRPLPPAPEERG